MSAMSAFQNEDISQALGQGTVFKDKNYAAIYYHEFAPIAPQTIYDYTVEEAVDSLFAKDERDICVLSFASHCVCLPINICFTTH